MDAIAVMRSMGAAPLAHLGPLDRVNKMMAAETIESQRAILWLCGQRILDETEVDTISGGATG